MSKKKIKFFLSSEIYDTTSEDLLDDIIVGMCSEAELFGALILEEIPAVDPKIMQIIISQYLSDLFTCFLNQTSQLTRDELRQLLGHSVNVLLSKLEPVIIRNILKPKDKKMKVVH